MAKQQELKRVLFIPDQHFPYNDKRYWKVLMQVCSQFKFETIVIQGDFVDCYTVSSHSKDPTRKLNLLEELEPAKKALRQLEGFGAKQLIYLEGNHEDRLKRFIVDKAPELYGCVTIQSLLELEKWKFVPYKEFTTLGQLFMAHDVDHAGKLAMQQTLDAVQDNIVFGHTHRLGVIYQGNAMGVAHVAINTGWGGDSNEIDYRKKIKVNKEWMLGFGIGYLDPQGVVHCQAIPVINYKVVIEGQLIKG